jgi:hypothetical protein
MPRLYAASRTIWFTAVGATRPVERCSSAAEAVPQARQLLREELSVRRAETGFCKE